MNNITELVFILDRSGSMSGKEEDVIGGFNSTVSEQREKDQKTYVTTVLFSDRSQTIHDRIDISLIPRMERKDFVVGGCTALIDAIGQAIDHIRDVHRYIRPEDKPDRTLFVIMTDGLENASSRYDSTTVKRMISAQKESGWEFLFLGANIDSVETAARFGIDASRAVNYHCDAKGIGASFGGVQKFMNVFFDTEADMEEVSCALSEGEWRKEADAEYEGRS